jgi:hypothetical protein
MAALPVFRYPQQAAGNPLRDDNFFGYFSGLGYWYLDRRPEGKSG